MIASDHGRHAHRQGPISPEQSHDAVDQNRIGRRAARARAPPLTDSQILAPVTAEASRAAAWLKKRADQASADRLAAMVMPKTGISADQAPAPGPTAPAEVRATIKGPRLPNSGNHRVQTEPDNRPVRCGRARKPQKAGRRRDLRCDQDPARGMDIGAPAAGMD